MNGNLCEPCGLLVEAIAILVIGGAMKSLHMQRLNKAVKDLGSSWLGSQVSSDCVRS